MRALDVQGHQFGRLRVLALAQQTAHGRIWKCRCTCGRTCLVQASALTSGRTTSCGCRHRELVAARNFVHGRTSTPEYGIWSHIIDRCTNQKCPSYKWYGGRGITICERWRLSFVAFLRDMGLRPSPHHTIDRIDNNGPYCPENCRWVTIDQQARNRRNNHVVTLHGKSQTLTDWLQEFHLSEHVYWARVSRYGWPVIRALTTPVRTNR
jgi:hypothetical protein